MCVYLKYKSEKKCKGEKTSVNYGWKSLCILISVQLSLQMIRMCAWKTHKTAISSLLHGAALSASFYLDYPTKQALPRWYLWCASSHRHLFFFFNQVSVFHPLRFLSKFHWNNSIQCRLDSFVEKRETHFEATVISNLTLSPSLKSILCSEVLGFLWMV